MKKYLLIFVCSIMFLGCATTLKSASKNIELENETGYIAGEFWDSHFYLFGFMMGSPYSLYIESVESGKIYTFKFGLKDKYEIYDIPAGDYFIAAISKVVTNPSSGGTYTASTKRLTVPEELLFDFRVLPGKITYLGSNRIYSEGSFFTKKELVDFKYDINEGKNKLAENYKKIDTSDIIEY